MTLRHLLAIGLLLPVLAAAQESDPTIASIEAVLDDFHDAAAHGDKARYLGHMADYGVFMGTDEWERWPKNPDFSNYVDSRFKDGSGWNYRSVERNVRLSEFSNVAWFDEVVFSETNGRFRGTGVLVLEQGEWKIAHYAMSFLVFNEIWEDVIKLTKQTQVEKDRAR